MRILLVYPEYPETFWSLKHALRFLSKRALYPPLGLLTVAAMLPPRWQRKLVDMNITDLKDEDLRWADYVFISAMEVQKKSVHQVLERCRKLKAKTVAGGPLFTTGYDQFEGIDHLVLNEAEVTLPLFLGDLEKGCAQPIYTSSEWPDLSRTPVPAWELLDIRKYALLSVQYSRGCPFNCEFCDVVVLNGHRPRTKSSPQLLVELDALYRRGWRDSVFIVDDNFVGNKRQLKEDTLPALIGWMKGRNYPFSLSTQASVNLADDEDLMRMMAEAGFNTVFVGIETPCEESLEECGKHQNEHRDLLACIKKIHSYGIQVQGGFIVGFDSDPPSIFERQISFIQNSGIVTAMVGLLNAPRGTRLYQRLEKENRLIADASGDNTDSSINFIPRMNYETLVRGYRRIIHTIYSARPHYERSKVLLSDYKPLGMKVSRLRLSHLKALLKSVWFLGIRGEGRQYYWKLLLWTLMKHPSSIALAVSFQISRYHFYKIAESYRRNPIPGLHRIDQANSRSLT